MEYQEKKKQIFMISGYNDALSGKIIDKVSFYKDGCNCECGELLITFTDNTFMLLSPQYENDVDTYVLNDDFIQPLNESSSKPGYVDKDGVFHWDYQFQRYIDCDIIEFDTNIIKSWIEKDIKNRNDREYQEYLRLKEKFEKDV